MSAFYLLGFFAVWVTLTGLLWSFWRRGRKEAGAKLGRIDIAFAVVALVWLAVSFWYGGGRKYYYDAEVERLCAIDGGIKVYEMVKLPADKFNQWGQPNFYNPTLKANALGPEFEFNLASEYVRKGPPNLLRFEASITRKQDGKLLGKSIEYKRSGGDMPGPWQSSTYLCPPNAGEVRLMENIFVRSTQ